MTRRDPATEAARRPAALLVSAPARNLAVDLLQVVSERTGYPSEMLPLDAALETDLGIDSVKRVEIVEAFRRKLSDAESQALAEADTLLRARTLRDMVTAAQDAVTSLEAADQPHSQDEVEIIRKATEVLGTTHVAQWMRSRIPSLENQTPYALMQTEEGRRQIERVLLKIEHGVY